MLSLSSAAIRGRENFIKVVRMTFIGANKESEVFDALTEQGWNSFKGSRVFFLRFMLCPRTPARTIVTKFRDDMVMYIFACRRVGEVCALAE